MPTDPAKFINRKIPEIPHDGNKKWLSPLMFPVVDVNGDIIGYAPPSVTVLPDGTAQLQVDTELTLNGDVIINNIKVASDDGVNANRFLKIDPATGALIVDAVLSVSGTVEHHNGTANIAAATVTFSAVTKHVQIENFSAGKNILVSFDGGATFRTIQPGVSLDIDGIMTDLRIKATADATPYEILALT